MANAGRVALARSLGGTDADWLKLAEAREHAPEPQATRAAGEAAVEQSLGLFTSRANGDLSAGIIEQDVGKEGEMDDLVLTIGDLGEGERALPPPSSSMKMGAPKIPQVNSSETQPNFAVFISHDV